MTMASESIFTGLKVLDVASFIAGPAAATVLSDFGADVIKVEPPAGDLQRMLSSVPPSPRARANYSWHLTNRNKRGMAIDLKSRGGTTILQRLVEWADVVITNFPHGDARASCTSATTRSRRGIRASSTRTSPASATPARTRSCRAST